MPAAAVAVAAGAELITVHLFPVGTLGFPAGEAVQALAFCVVLLALTWRVERAQSLRGVLAVYLVAVVAIYVIPTGLGHDIARVRLVALPIALLVAALRRWRPLPPVLVAVGLAAAWNVFPLASAWASSTADRSANAKVWPAPVSYLQTHLRPGYRVEAVDTVDHWPALYLARANIPLVRGWFRQDDHPVANLLYHRFTPGEYVAWLRRLGVAYVVLTDAPPDHSSRREARLVKSGETGLRRVFATPAVSIYAVPRPQAIVDRARSPRGAHAGRVAARHPGRARRDLSGRGPLVAVLARVHRLPHPRPRRDAAAADRRRSDGADRVRRRREQPVRRLRRHGPHLPASATSFQVTDCY